MKYIEDFKDGETITGHYLCKKKEMLKSKTGKNYMSLILSDKTGNIGAKVWELNNSIQSFEAGDFIKVEGSVVTYLNELQFKLVKIRKSQEGEYSPGDYIPTGSRDIDEIMEHIDQLIHSIENVYIRKLLENMLINNKEIRSAFQTHSAAKNMHHSYMGGLAEHSLNVAEICDFLGSRYKFVNRDILVAGALLHDLAKIYELSAFPDNDYTDEGQLIGHIVMGAELIGQEADKISGFPPRLRNLLRHNLLAHHGEYEYGSPKLPKTIEALILHSVDDMDAKAAMFEDMFKADSTSGDWAGYNRILGRDIRKTQY